MNATPGQPREPGDQLSHYRLIKPLGKGGMGEVFVAEDLTLGRQVALKILPSGADSSPERLERFRREARTVAALNHPNIVTIYSVEEDQGVRFLTMEKVEGESLRQRLSGGALDPDTFLDLAIDLAEALVAAHERGVIHRDLKPENIMVTPSGSIKVLDFGIAKLVRSGDEDQTSDVVTASLTRDGYVVGTIPYMSPEQLRGVSTGPETDIFSLGVIFYEMLTGRRPFRGKTASDMISAILRDAPIPLAELRDDVLADRFDPIVARCLEKDPQNRYPSAVELHQSLVDRRDLLTSRRHASSGGAWSPRRSLSASMRRVIDRPGAFLFDTRPGLFVVVGLVFLANYLETRLEAWVARGGGPASGMGYRWAEVAHWFEGLFVFESHHQTNAWAVYGLSLSYYFVFPVLVLYAFFATARRPDIRPFRVMAMSPVFAYLIHLPFFVLFPLPERWAYPESGAMLLSDLWSTRLIESVRPISGLDNCFPSFHVSMTVILIIVCLRFRVRFRSSLVLLGLTVILATLGLGIHWVIDVVSGICVGIIAVRCALWFDGRRTLNRLQESGSSSPE